MSIPRNRKALQVALNEMSDEELMRQLQSGVEEALERDGDEFEIPIPAEILAPDRFAERGIHSERIQEALDELSEDFREVIILRDVQLLSYEEISAITGLPMGTVKSRINRGRGKLQEKLKDVYLPEDG